MRPRLRFNLVNRMLNDPDLWCPSATSKAVGPEIFGVLRMVGRSAQISYLERPVAARPDLLALAKPIVPEQIFRFTAPCAGEQCANFGNGRCAVAARLVDTLDPGQRSLPPCGIRRRCLWWHQEGAAACQRCEQVTTSPIKPTNKEFVLAGESGIVRAELLGE